MTFEKLLAVAIEAEALAVKGNLDMGMGDEAVTVAAVLFRWLEANATAEQKVAIATLLVSALGLEG